MAADQTPPSKRRRVDVGPAQTAGAASAIGAVVDGATRRGLPAGPPAGPPTGPRRSAQRGPPSRPGAVFRVSSVVGQRSPHECAPPIYGIEVTVATAADNAIVWRTYLDDVGQYSSEVWRTFLGAANGTLTLNRGDVAPRYELTIDSGRILFGIRDLASHLKTLTWAPREACVQAMRRALGELEELGCWGPKDVIVASPDFGPAPERGGFLPGLRHSWPADARDAKNE